MELPRPNCLGLVDTAWYHMERPTNLMVIGGLMLFDEPLDMARLQSVFERRLVRLYPRFGMRIVESPLGPRWRRADFDIRNHVHRIALPRPGDDRALAELTGDLMSTPLDFAKPLWDTHLIEGYRGGCALLTRLHHCLGDGAALMGALLDLTDTSPSARHHVRMTRRAQSRPALARLAEVLTPAGAARGLTGVAASALTLAHLTLLWPDPASSLRGHLGMRKQVAWTGPIEIETLRPLRAMVHCTVNDIMLTAVTGALRRELLRGRSGVPERIRAMVPVDLRATPDDHPAGNWFGLVFLDLPVGISDVAERLAVIHDEMAEQRRSPEPAVALEVLGAIGLAPRVVHRLAVRFFGAKATAVVTNVRGPAEARYLAGAPIRMQTFFVPQSAELGIGVAVFSTAGEIRVSIIADAGLVADPWRVAAGIEAEVAELLGHPEPAVRHVRGHAEPPVRELRGRAQRPAPKRGARRR